MSTLLRRYIHFIVFLLLVPIVLAAPIPDQFINSDQSVGRIRLREWQLPKGWKGIGNSELGSLSYSTKISADIHQV